MTRHPTPRSRSKNLAESDVDEIVQILDGWTGELTWEALIDAIERRKYARYARQTLHKHRRIHEAFALRKKALVRNREQAASMADAPHMQATLQRIARLEAETTRLQAENDRLKEMFLRWAYNASTRGLSQDFLDRALPGVDRDRTRPATPGRKAAKP